MFSINGNFLFNLQFSGYQQHDTQEFLNYLLDGLHEDLNKILKKPLVEKDETNEVDEIKSKKAWIGFLRRNQSILVELLYGQYKSTLYCPDDQCGNISTTFDPFLSISLPLASRTKTYIVVCFFLFYNTKLKASKIEIPFNSECTMMALRNKISLLLNIDPFSFIIGKLESTAGFDNFVPSSSLLRGNNISINEPKRLFLIQINPDLFYSDVNKIHREGGIFTKRNYENIKNEVKSIDLDKIFSDDHEENEHGQTSESLCYYSRFNHNGKQINIKLNTDNNYGFDKFLHSIIYLRRYDDNTNDTSSRVKIIFPRIMTIGKEWTTKETHFEVFKFILPVLLKYEEKNDIKKFDELKNKSEIELFSFYFNNYESSLDKDTVEFQKKQGYPYRLRLKNYNGFMDNCYYCNKKNCDDCLFPFSDEITVNDLLKKIPKNEEMEIDNTYLYLKENQRSYAIKNRDFNIELTFLHNYHDSVKSLNEFDDISFNMKKLSSAKSISIYDCFKNFVKLEILKEDNEWFCPACKKHQKAKKKMEIYNAPPILIIHLKRFSANSKIDTTVDFPIENLDLTQYVINKNNQEGHLLYDLFAISNHFGGLGGGHYIAYAKNYLNNEWYEFNDSSCHKISIDSLVSSSAYVLFYRKKNIDMMNLQQLYIKPFENYEETKNETKKDEMSID